MSSDTPAQLRTEYDECIAKINSLTAMVKQLSGEHELEGLEEVVAEEDYFNLLANSLYAVNSLAFGYCNTKGVPFPPEFVPMLLFRPKSRSTILRLKTHWLSLKNRLPPKQGLLLSINKQSKES
jgi:hypothetical protein